MAALGERRRDVVAIVFLSASAPLVQQMNAPLHCGAAGLKVGRHDSIPPPLRSRRHLRRRSSRNGRSRCPKEWLAGWLHALHASFVPQADCTFSSIGLTERQTERTAGRFVIDGQTVCRPREILSLLSCVGARSRSPCIKIACTNGKSGRSGGRRLLGSFVGVLLIIGSGSLWVLNRIGLTDFDREGEGRGETQFGIDRWTWL